MSFQLTRLELEKELSEMLGSGLVGTSKDFYQWVRMEIKRKFKEHPDCSLEDVTSILEDWKSEGRIEPGKYDPREYSLPSDSSLWKKVGREERFFLLGAIEYSPMQFVRSRLSWFLEQYNTPPELILDLCIATVEAVENAVKYGDGEVVEVEFIVDKSRLFRIQLINNVKEQNLQDDIRRGKYSSTATLMRGMMVMQKLFDKVDLDVKEGTGQAVFEAEKKLP